MVNRVPNDMPAIHGSNAASNNPGPHNGFDLLHAIISELRRAPQSVLEAVLTAPSDRCYSPLQAALSEGSAGAVEVYRRVVREADSFPNCREVGPIQGFRFHEPIQDCRSQEEFASASPQRQSNR